MPVNQLIYTQLSEADLILAVNKLNEVIEIVSRSSTNITPEERKRYGSIKEHKKLLVEKTIHYRNQHPDMSSPDVDWDKYNSSWQSRKGFEQLESICDTLKEMCSDPRILHDYFLFENALVEYGFTKYKAANAAQGAYTTKMEDLKQFFPNSNGRKGKAV